MRLSILVLLAMKLVKLGVLCELSIVYFVDVRMVGDVLVQWDVDKNGFEPQLSWKILTQDNYKT